MRDTKLVNALREHAEWAQANEWETPITLCDDLAEAADQLENQNAHVAALQQEIEKLRAQLPRWIPCSERPPEELEPVNVVWVNHRPEPYYWEIKDVTQKATAVYYRKKWYWWSCVCEDFLAEYGRNEPDLVDSGIEITHWMPLPELPEEAEQWGGDAGTERR